nr:Cytidine and deoxycytidylate deaminase zinc-binding region [uncultured bacterium]
MIKYPFVPEGGEYKYVNLANQYMRLARNYAWSDSIDKDTPTASVIVKDNKIIGIGANGSDFHKKNECVRVIKKIPTGQGYELCEGCHPKNHSEQRAIKDALSKNNDIEGADLYLWGHWWCCQWCWEEIIKAKIKNVYLLQGSEKLFNDDSAENILGKQFVGALAKN